MQETEEGIRGGSIVVAVDGSYHADQAAVWAADVARLKHRPLTIVYVERRLGAQEQGWLAQAGISPSEVSEEIRADSEELLRRAQDAVAVAAPAVQTDTILRTGDPRELLPELAEHASMIVMGSRGRGPVSSLRADRSSSSPDSFGLAPTGRPSTSGDTRFHRSLGRNGT